PPSPPSIHTLSLHDALPISPRSSETGSRSQRHCPRQPSVGPDQISCLPSRVAPAIVKEAPCEPDVIRNSARLHGLPRPGRRRARSEEHTSELQSLAYLVCRL